MSALLASQCHRQYIGGFCVEGKLEEEKQIPHSTSLRAGSSGMTTRKADAMDSIDSIV